MCFKRLIIIGLITSPFAAMADDRAQFDINLYHNSQLNLGLETQEFDEIRLGGFERTKIDGIRVRGWKFGNAYIGQTKVANKWGLGFVYKQGDVAYGVNNRGIQVRLQF